MAFALRLRAPFTAKAESPTTTIRVGRKARSLAAPPPRSSAAATTSGPFGSTVGSKTHGLDDASDSPQLSAPVLASAVKPALSSVFVPSDAGTRTEAFSKNSVHPASGRVTAWPPRSETSTSEPLNVRDGDTAMNGSCRTPQSASSDPTPALGDCEVSTSIRPPACRYPSSRRSSVRENGSRAPATSNTAQSSGIDAACTRSRSFTR